MEEFSKESYVTWRVMTTYPNAGRKNIFRKDYRCQHSTDKRATGAGPSKNTDCPATLVVIVKRFEISIMLSFLLYYHLQSIVFINFLINAN